MASTPPAMTMSYAPLITPCAAKWMACWLDPHWRSTVVPGTLSGKPAARTALRPTFRACSPAWITHPTMTSSTRTRVDAGALHQGRQHFGHQIDGMPVFQTPVSAPNGGTDCVNNHCFALCHEMLLVSVIAI